MSQPYPEPFPGRSRSHAGQPVLPPGAFVLLPVVPGNGWANSPLAQWQRDLYEWAFQQAVAAARPSYLERDPLAFWN